MSSRETPHRGTRIWMGMVALLAALSLSACVAIASPGVPPAVQHSAAEPVTSPPEITIIARDFAFDMPAEIPSGWVSLTLTNEGKVNHHGIVMRLLEGVSVDGAVAAMDNPDADLSKFSDLQFFLPDTGPGMSNQATVEMAPGQWVIFSVSMDATSIGASEEPVPDYVLGSIQEFDVTEDDSMAAAPKADLTLDIGADDFDLPEELAAGLHTIEVVNDSGQDNGYAFILKMEGGATMGDVLAAFDALFSGQEMDMESMPVFNPVGGLMAYNLGDRYYTTVNLEPGDYTVVSSIDATGFPYTGLSKKFTVPGDQASAGGPQTSNGEIPELLIEVSDDGIMAPQEAPGGIVHVVIDNTGSQLHTAELWRIKEGHSADEVLAMNEHLKDNPDDYFGVFDLASWIHYADAIEPGSSAQFYADLGTGEFFLSDETNPDADLVFFRAPEVVGVTEPVASVSVDMADFWYTMPDIIPAGEQLWEFRNSGTQWHLGAIVNDNPDASMEEILAVFAEDSLPAPGSPVQIFGGMPPMSPGERVWMSIDLEPGTYDLVCPLPDIAALMNGGGPPVTHLEHGMLHAFEVTGS